MKATHMVHWPGKDTPACDRHTDQLKRLAECMGFVVSVSPDSDLPECKNCEHEKRTAVRSLIKRFTAAQGDEI